MNSSDINTVPAEVATANLFNTNGSQEKQYIFTPAGLDVKLTLAILSAFAGLCGFLGNLFVLRFIRQKEKKRQITAMPSSLDYFIRSLALSDVLCVSICIPIFLIQCFVDIVQNGWPCKLSRFFMFLFPSITAYNLVIISLERYILTCRPISRPLTRVSVQRLVKLAWILGFVVACVPLYTNEGIRVDLNSTHYTVVCQLDRNSHLKHVAFQILTVVVFIIPFTFISFACAVIIKTLRKMNFHAASADYKEAMRKWHIKQRKGTLRLLAIIFAFLMPYFVLEAFNIYILAASPPADFKRDFVIRSTGALLAYLNSAVNFCIHLVQLPGFSESFKNNSCFPKQRNITPVYGNNGHELRKHNERDVSVTRDRNNCGNKSGRRASMTNLLACIHQLGRPRRHSI